MSTKKRRKTALAAPARSKASPDFAQDYSQVVQGAELRDVSLMSLNMSISGDFFGTPKAERNFALDDNLNGFNMSGATAVAVFEWKVTVTNKDDAELLSITSSWFVMYAGVSPQKPQAVEAFVKRVGRFASYPYFRGLVSQLNWAAGADLPIMPVLR